MEVPLLLNTLLAALGRGLVMAGLAATLQASAAEVRLLAPNAAKEAVLEAVSRFEQATGHKVLASWSGTEAITQRVGGGEIVDVVVNAAQNIDRLTADGKLAAGSRTDFARSSIGVATAPSAAAADVSTVDGLKAALLAARSVVISSGTSGRHLQDVFARLGVAEQVKPKLKQPPSGAQIGDFLASGEVELGFQQVSELLHVKGIRYLGALPAELQSYTVYAGGLHAQAAQPEAAKALLTALRQAEVAAAVRRAGMEPL
jgi:molybdate transport system substrate-binding protein